MFVVVMSLILSLPHEILMKILKFCNVKDLCQISQTDKQFAAILSDKALWYHFCRRDFPQLDFGSSVVKDDFRHVYRCEVVNAKSLRKVLLHIFGFKDKIKYWW